MSKKERERLVRVENNTDEVLRIENLNVEYRTDEGVAKAVNDLTLVVKKGKTVGLVGETGSGKTTTALSILRLVPDPPGVVTADKIILDGMDINELTEGEMDYVRGSVASMIFQDPMTALNPIMTVSDQIEETLRIHEGLSKEEAKNRAGEMLELVGIPRERGKDYPHQFSGGMKQRVVIAIAFSCNPKLLIADEPTTALDVTIQAQVLAQMKELRDKFGMAMIMITHDLGIVAQTCDEVAVVYAGRVIEYGHIRDVFKNTKHPYTKGLFGSLPRINDDRDMLEPIPGLMPDPMELPPGCPFAPRCKYATDKCNEALPNKYFFENDHYAMCCRYDEADFTL